MNFLILGLAAASVVLTFPLVMVLALKRYASANFGDSDVVRCYGLDGRSSEICCDNPGFADAGCSCDCLCHHRDESFEAVADSPRDFGHGKILLQTSTHHRPHHHHHHCQGRRAVAELHSSGSRGF